MDKDEIAEKLLAQLLNAIANNKPFIIKDKDNNTKIIFQQNIIAIQLNRSKSQTHIILDYTTKQIIITINDNGEIKFSIRPDSFNY